MSDLNTLLTDYRAEQKEIVRKRRSGEFRNKTKDLTEERDSFDKFLCKKYLLTRDEKDLFEMLSYFGKRFIHKYTELRNKFYLGEISAKQRASMLVEGYDEFEAPLIKFGVTTGNSTAEFRFDQTCKISYPIEDEFLKNEGSKNISGWNRENELREATEWIAFDYFRNYFETYKK